MLSALKNKEGFEAKCQANQVFSLGKEASKFIRQQRSIGANTTSLGLTRLPLGM